MRYLTKFEKWKFPWKNADSNEPEDLKSIVENEIESNSGIVIVAFRLGKEIKSKTIIIPFDKRERIIIRMIGYRCEIKKGNDVLELDKKEFTRFWNKCVEKKYKFILK